MTFSSIRATPKSRLSSRPGSNTGQLRLMARNPKRASGRQQAAKRLMHNALKWMRSAKKCREAKQLGSHGAEAKLIPALTDAKVKLVALQGPPAPPYQRWLTKDALQSALKGRGGVNETQGIYEPSQRRRKAHCVA